MLVDREVGSNEERCARFAGVGIHTCVLTVVTGSEQLMFYSKLITIEYHCLAQKGKDVLDGV